MQPPRLRHRVRRRADVLDEQPMQVSGTDADPRGEFIHRRRVEHAFVNQPSARLTMADVPSQAGVPGAASGRHRKHGRNPASAADAAVA